MSVRRVRDALVAVLGPDAHVENHANHTGAGKLSFAVTVGGRRLWAKVAADEDEDWPLTTWSRVAELLAERHAAPPLLDTLAVDGRTRCCSRSSTHPSRRGAPSRGGTTRRGRS